MEEEGGLDKDASCYLVRDSRTEKVQCLRLSSLLLSSVQNNSSTTSNQDENNNSNIGLLKIDAELAEARILRGIDAKDFARIDQIAIEVHSEKLLDECQDMLREHYRSIFALAQTIPGHFMLYASHFDLETEENQEEDLQATEEITVEAVEEMST